MAHSTMATAMRSALPITTLARRWLAGLLLALAVLATYVPALTGQFIWDDDIHVTVPSLRSWTGLWRIWTDPTATQQYYPLTHTAFWIEHRLWGQNPTGYHLVNVALHITSALLLWRLLERLAVPGALLATAIFALHPVHVESVAWVTELKNTLSGALYLAAFLTYLTFDPPGRPTPVSGRQGVIAGTRDQRFYWLALALYACALLAKTVTASLPAAVLLVVWWKEGRLGWRRHVAPLIPFFVLGAALGLTTAWLERYVLGAEGDAYVLTPIERLLIAGRALWFYAGKLVWPVNLIFIYPRWRIDAAAWWQYLYLAGALAAVVALATLRRRIGRGPLCAALYFGGTLVPALGFFNLYPFVYSFVADHFQYLASLGLITLAAALIATALLRLGVWGRPVGHAACALLLLGLAALSWQQAHVYKDVETLYRDVIARNPSAAMAYLNLGGHYWQQGRHAEAIALYRALIAMRPDYVGSYTNLGIVYASQRHYAEAIALYRKAIALKPSSMAAHYELGLAHAAEGRPAEAIAEYETALALQPDFVKGYQSLAAVYSSLGRHAEAVSALERARTIAPELAETHYALGLAYAASGQPAPAITAFKAAIAARPDHAEVYNDLGLLYRKQGRVPEAIAAYWSAITIKPTFAAAYNNLGAAYGVQGKYAEAIAAWQSAVRLDPDSAIGRTAQANLEMVRARLGR